MSVYRHRAAKKIALIASYNKCAFFNWFPLSHFSVALHVNDVAVDNPYDTLNIFNRTFVQKFSIQLLPIPGLSTHPIDNANVPVISNLQLSEADV